MKVQCSRGAKWVKKRLDQWTVLTLCNITYFSFVLHNSFYVTKMSSQIVFHGEYFWHTIYRAHLQIKVNILALSLTLIYIDNLFLTQPSRLPSRLRYLLKKTEFLPSYWKILYQHLTGYSEHNWNIYCKILCLLWEY